MNAERLGSLFWLVVGAGAVQGGIELGLGSTAQPGPGFLSTVAGAFVAILALFVFLKSLGADPEGRAHVSSLWADSNWPRALWVALLTLGFIAAFEHLGFFLSSFVLLVAMMRGIEGLPWRTALIIPALAILVTWLLFAQVLKMSLPAGFLGS